jgi:hypothetical protein
MTQKKNTRPKQLQHQTHQRKLYQRRRGAQEKTAPHPPKKANKTNIMPAKAKKCVNVNNTKSDWSEEITITY